MMGRRKKHQKPQWQKDVDRDMRLYLVWAHVIRQQENIILSRRATGLRTTAVYELREGGACSSPENQLERMMIDIDFAERKIAAGEQYREHMEEVVRLVAGGDADKETFIKRYWWTSVNSPVRAKISYVLEALPFLAYRNQSTGKMTAPTRNFFVWREQIYQGLGEMLGYLER
jgi:hypothetical protein